MYLEKFEMHIMEANSLINSGVDILRSEGPITLLAEGEQYLRNYLAQSFVAHQLSKRELQTVMLKEDKSLENILDTVLEVHPGFGAYELAVLQLRDELSELVELVDENDPEVIMEIGTAQGGTLYTWSQYIDSVTQCISIDIPGRVFASGFYERRQQFFSEFSNEKEFSFVWQSSHLDETRRKLEHEVLASSDDVDFLFIDGDHTYDGVKRDFEMYSDLVSDAGIIAFHDIVPHPNESSVIDERRNVSSAQDRHLRWTKAHPDCQVNKFWNEIKDDYRTTEIISHPEQTWGGIGVIHL